MRKETKAALGVFALALVLRAGWALREPAPWPPQGDAAQYHAYAQTLLRTGEYAGPRGERAGRMPGYPLLLAGVYSAAGPSPRAVQMVQAALGAAACALIYWLALALLSGPWPLLCGLAAALYFDLFSTPALLLTETLYGTLLAAGLALLYNKRPVWGGGFLGAAALTRPEIFPFALAAPWLLGRRASRARAAAACLAVALPVLLWTARNWAVLGRPLPTTSVSGLNLYLGLRLPLDQMELTRGPLPEPAPELGELERDAQFKKEYLALKSGLSWSVRLRCHAYNLLAMWYPFLPEYDASYALLLPFWLWGLWLSLARPELRPLALLVVGLSAVYAIFAGPVSRYRFGLSPVLIVLAGAGAQALRQRLGPRRFQRAALAWASANLAIWLWAPAFRSGALKIRALLWR